MKYVLSKVPKINSCACDIDPDRGTLEHLQRDLTRQHQNSRGHLGIFKPELQ